MGRLDGKVAVITGAGGGMGREAAIVFAEEGAQVCAADIDGAAAEQVASEAGDALAVQVDVADGASVQAMYAAAAERFGGSTSSTTTPGSRRRTTTRSSRPRKTPGTASRT